jgi:cellulose biosynthesis protein BcsQ
VKATDHGNLDLLPADFSYRHLDLALDQFKKPAARLGRVLEPLRAEYQYIFLDCPPSISLVSESVFETADSLLVPVIPSTLSARTYQRLEELSRHGKVGSRTHGTSILAFFSMADVNKRLHIKLIDRLRRLPDLTVLGPAIPTSDEIELMGEERNPVELYAPACPAALAYRALWKEIQQHLGSDR